MYSIEVIFYATFAGKLTTGTFGPFHTHEQAEIVLNILAARGDVTSVKIIYTPLAPPDPPTPIYVEEIPF